ncbi:hypothetical protein [Bradyrhizobium sp. 1]|uniref:hypothetical protein n=1 Tax=Bradyrhizobium sp. 1 TaxID=241591 RepID=UPI001FF876ED|nr:hypothetical protein [Bradyrhizobium sp. 1]MCK1391408.1 hypothetical protein [Bradyrhizobium sp. 1]
MTKSKLFVVAAVAISAALATPAFAQWQSQEPAAYAAQYPNGDPNLASPNLSSSMTRGTMAFVPSPKSPRPTVMRATKGK